MHLKDLLAPVLRLLGRAAMDTARKGAKDLAGPEPKHRAGQSRTKAGRAAIKKARQAARITRRRG